MVCPFSPYGRTAENSLKQFEIDSNTGCFPESVSGGFSFSTLLYRGKVAPSPRVRSGQPLKLRGIDFEGFYVDFDGFWAGRV